MIIADQIRHFEQQLPEGSALFLLVGVPKEAMEDNVNQYCFLNGTRRALVAMVLGALRHSPSREIIMEALTLAHEQLGKEVMP